MTFKDIRIFIINKIWKFVEDEDNFMVLKSNIRIYERMRPDFYTFVVQQNLSINFMFYNQIL